MARRLSMARGVAGVALVLLAAPLFAVEPSAPRLTSLEAALDRIFRVAQTSPGVEQVSDLLPSSSLPPGTLLHTGEATFDSPHVLMVRVKDGKPVLGCVDSREAAERFLKAPADKLGGRTAAAEEK